MKVITENILDIIESGGEKELSNDLSAFSSPMNTEIEDFIHNRAIYMKDRYYVMNSIKSYVSSESWV